MDYAVLVLLEMLEQVSIECRKIKARVQWHPAITKCHGTKKSVRYSEILDVEKTPLKRIIWLRTKIFVIAG